MKYIGLRKLLSSLDTRRTLMQSILVYKNRPERTGFNMYALNTQQQLTFLALLRWHEGSIEITLTDPFRSSLKSQTCLLALYVLSAVFSVLKFMTISLEEEQQGEDEMQDVAANVDTFDDVVIFLIV